MSSTVDLTKTLSTAVGRLSSVSFASALDQSVDCVKLVGLDGTIQYMNSNGLCAMEIDDFDLIRGRPWSGIWPEATRATIDSSLASAASGVPAQFRAFCPTAKGDPRWWDVTVSKVADEDGRPAGFLTVSRDVTDYQRSRAALEIAAAEMKHRLKNTYMMISSLMIGFARGDAEREAFASEMASRLVAISKAQSLFTADEASCDLTELIPALVAPFGNAMCRVTIDPIPGATVNQGQADAIALVMGELSVNAAKHGALAHGGTIHIGSQLDRDSLHIVWNEQSASPPSDRERAGGQGLKLMDRIVRARAGSMHIDWTGSGLTATLAFHLG